MNHTPSITRKRERFWKLKKLQEPLHNNHLELGGSRRSQPVKPYGVKPGKKHFTKKASSTCTRREITEKTRTLPMGYAWNYMFIDILQYGFYGFGS
ncbi:hypothetical protein HanXRQr2_Chr01g0042831 [Helianthus annuus]|uniref:Uncharacterized protein n=1 Tax=Helianthus annuus TaxID=4232 RepID=A0A9K3K053_HELAN|nr:hypothetical protein HanXRQr2_Chr01g0042831 [Helianthus annuus]KAJ0958763.1 hypothetical protein HanPSC8_Chr01g0042441 [Helianthus annuus]